MDKNNQEKKAIKVIKTLKPITPTTPATTANATTQSQPKQERQDKTEIKTESKQDVKSEFKPVLNKDTENGGQFQKTYKPLTQDRRDNYVDRSERPNNRNRYGNRHDNRNDNRNDNRYDKRYDNRNRHNNYQNNYHNKTRDTQKEYKTEKYEDEEEHETKNEKKRDQTDDNVVSIGENTKKFDELPVSVDDFEDMDFLSKELFNGLCDYGFKKPSPIQAKTIHIINSGSDLIAQSQSGSGKTGAFTIGALSRIDTKQYYPQVVFLANTRLLALQIMKVVENISRHMNVDICLCVGGHKTNSQTNAQQVKNSHVIVGTPGRVCDMLTKNAFDGKKIKTLIMDESDVLLKEDFRDQIRDIIEHLGNTTQICVFSATFTKDTLELTEAFLKDPYRVTVEKEMVTVKDVKQFVIRLRDDNDKFPTLLDLFSKLTFNQMIIFVRSIRNAEDLRNRLMDRKIQTGLVHGKMNSVDRENILREFRLNYTKIIISTDVMCRGIDIDDLRVVVNYDMPEDPETYIHRVGRSGRFGGQGIAINFSTYNDEHKINTLNREYGVKIAEMPDTDEVNEIITGIKPSSYKVKSSNNYL